MPLPNDFEHSKNIAVPLSRYLDHSVVSREYRLPFPLTFAVAAVWKGIAIIDLVFEARWLSRGWFLLLFVVVASRRPRLVVSISVSVTAAAVSIALFLPTPLLVFLLVAWVSSVRSVRSAFVVLFLLLIGVSLAFFVFLAAHFCVGCQPFHFPQKGLCTCRAHKQGDDEIKKTKRDGEHRHRAQARVTGNAGLGGRGRGRTAKAMARARARRESNGEVTCGRHGDGRTTKRENSSRKMERKQPTSQLRRGGRIGLNLLLAQDTKHNDKVVPNLKPLFANRQGIRVYQFP